MNEMTTNAAETNNAVQTTEPVELLEREPCSRCGGSGHYSYCQMYGTTCFRCQGKKQTLTKRGAAAMAYLIQIRSKRAADVKPGDRVSVCGKFRTVECLKDQRLIGSSTVNGVTTDYDVMGVQIVCVGNIALTTSRDKMIEVRGDADYMRRTLAEAVAYQKTLTKNGTPRKR